MQDTFARTRTRTSARDDRLSCIQSLSKWFDDKDALAVISFIERALRDSYKSKTKLTSLIGSGTSYTSEA